MDKKWLVSCARNRYLMIIEGMASVSWLYMFLAIFVDHWDFRYFLIAALVLESWNSRLKSAVKV